MLIVFSPKKYDHSRKVLSLNFSIMAKAALKFFFLIRLKSHKSTANIFGRDIEKCLRKLLRTPTYISFLLPWAVCRKIKEEIVLQFR